MSHCVIRLPGPLRIVAVAWLVVLPWIGRRPPIGRFLRAMEEGNGNPSAMVYGGLSATSSDTPGVTMIEGLGSVEIPLLHPVRTECDADCNAVE
jgi:hypothetical protein